MAANRGGEWEWRRVGAGCVRVRACVCAYVRAFSVRETKKERGSACIRAYICGRECVFTRDCLVACVRL